MQPVFLSNYSDDKYASIMTLRTVLQSTKLLFKIRFLLFHQKDSSPLLEGPAKELYSLLKPSAVENQLNTS